MYNMQFLRAVPNYCYYYYKAQEYYEILVIYAHTEIVVLHKTSLIALLCTQQGLLLLLPAYTRTKVEKFIRPSEKIRERQ